MSVVRTARYKVGAKIGDHHTVVGTVDDKPGRHPIYVVWDHRAWCPMACKIFPSQQRAEQEAEVISAMAHPGIVRLFGIGSDANLFLEYVVGQPLGDLMDDKPDGHLSLSDALRVAIHIGGALEHVRDRGFMHLDLNPTNVLVTARRPVLIDFGTARRPGDKRPSRPVGTDAYIAPEECLLQDVTPAADVFALGVTLFELLTGKMPFPKGTKTKPFPQLDREPMSIRKPRASLPKGLDELVLTCLSRDPAARPSLVELLPRLNDFIRSGQRMWPAKFRPGIERIAGPP